MQKRWWLAVLAAVAFVALLTWLPVRPGNGQESAAGGARPCGPDAQPANLDFTIRDMDGKPVTLAAFKGKVVLINFWATWCSPCRAEIPHLVDLQAQYRDRGLIVLGVSVDDPIEQLKAFAREFEINYPVLVGADRDDVQAAYGPLFGIPVTVLISREGRICRRFVGGASRAQFEREIRALL